MGNENWKKKKIDFAEKRKRTVIEVRDSVPGAHCRQNHRTPQPTQENGNIYILYTIYFWSKKKLF